MTVFKLKSFPNVCRLCLQQKPPTDMLPVDSYRPASGRSVAEMIEEFISLKTPAELTAYLPSELCEECLEVFEFFYKYKRKQELVQRFVTSLAEVKCGNQQPLVELFDTEKDRLQVLFKDLDVCDREDVRAEDLLDEFFEYDIASTICVKVESGSESEADLDSLDQVKAEQGVVIEYQDRVEELTDDAEETEPADFLETFVVKELDFHELQLNEDSTSEYTLLADVDDDDEEEEEDYEIEMNTEDDAPRDEPPAKRRQVRLPEEETERQVCDLLNCKFSTVFASHFEKHLAKVHGELAEDLLCHRHGCEEREPFATLDLLRQHKTDAHGAHICMICGKVVKHLVALENHMKVHTRLESLRVLCELCDGAFRSETELQKHAAKMHAVRYSFECHECGLGFKQKILLTQHLLTHSVERNYNCKQCNMSFKTSNHLRRHVRTVHVEIRYKCEHCTMSYGRRDKLRMHMERAHDIQTYFLCDICCASFEYNAKLLEHKERHERPAELECGICLTACPSAEDFNEHLCINYQDDYVCCKRDFRYHSFYNRHMFLKHGVNTNARVRPKAGVLMGKQRAMRKAVERCPKCEHVFPSRKMKKQHMQVCEGQVVIFEIEPVEEATPMLEMQD